MATAVELKRMPMLSYSIMKEVQLRKKCAELFLDAKGSKEKLVTRHKEFVMRHNSAVDAGMGRTAREIASEVAAHQRMKVSDWWATR